MNCEEVSKHLTEYLDKALDTAMTTRVATHVISCALCRAESNEIADCIQQVAALPAIDPPLGFAQRVMAHIHDGEPKASLWQRLIVPLTSRVPVQATAMALIAIIAVALFQTEQPLKQNNDVNLALQSANQAPAHEKELATANATPTTVTKTPELNRNPGAQANAPTEAAKLAVAETSRRTAPAAPAQSQQLQPTAPASIRAELESAVEEKKEAPRRPPLRVQEVTTARDAMPMLGDPRGFNVPGGAMRQVAPRPAPMVLERSIPLGDRVADFEFVVRRRSPQRRDTIEHLGSADSLQKSSEGEIPPLAAAQPAASPSTGRAKIESIAEIRYYNVTPEHFEIFKKELAAEANIESEPKVTTKEVEAAKQADRQLLVKVTILPADQAQPSR